MLGRVSYFDDQAEAWDDDPAKVRRAREVAAALRQRLPLRSDQRVLDVGGGTGMLSILLADAVGSVTVGDASAGMVAVAARRIEEAGLADRLDARRLDLTEDDVAPASYDGVWSMLALHHVAEVDRLLERVARCLRPGGFLAVVDLDRDPEGAFHRHVEDFHGHDGFDRAELAERLRGLGLTDVATDDIGCVRKDVDGQERSFSMFLATARSPRRPREAAGV